MNQIIKNIVAALEDKFLLLILILALFLSAAPSRAQVTGTYINPRITTVFNQPVTNGGNYTFIATNWLNASGWHNVNFILSEIATNWISGLPTTNNIGTNQIGILLYGSAGSGNNYTNAAAGTNFVYTLNPILTWSNNITATNIISGIWTNLTQGVGDSWLLYKGTIACTLTNANATAVTNATWLQIDAVITP